MNKALVESAIVEKMLLIFVYEISNIFCAFQKWVFAPKPRKNSFMAFLSVFRPRKPTFIIAIRLYSKLATFFVGYSASAQEK